MRKSILMLLVILLSAAPLTADQPAPEDINAWVATCRGAMGKLGKALKAELQAPRNPANAPNAWEMETLQQFETRKAAGEQASDLDAWTIVVDDQGHRTFRYMKAIATVPMCLQCHGRRLNDEIAAKVAALYPEDAAIGFKAGDLRGAFTVRLPID